jgi:hypothetical protein
VPSADAAKGLADSRSVTTTSFRPPSTEGVKDPTSPRIVIRTSFRPPSAAAVKDPISSRTVTTVRRPAGACRQLYDQDEAVAVLVWAGRVVEPYHNHMLAGSYQPHELLFIDHL